MSDCHGTPQKGCSTHNECAGAWLREPGTGFTSISSTLRSFGESLQSETGLYGEYGLRQRLTLGIDINELSGIGGHVLVFVRFPLGHTIGRTKVSFELAVGGHHLGRQWGSMVKSTVSVGRGFSSRWGNGWANIDAAIERRHGNFDPAYKLDAVVGLSSGRRVRPILRLETTHVSGMPLIWAVTPGLMIDGRKDTTWLIGLERKTAGQSSLGLKFGIWRQF